MIFYVPAPRKTKYVFTLMILPSTLNYSTSRYLPTRRSWKYHIYIFTINNLCDSFVNYNYNNYFIEQLDKSHVTINFYKFLCSFNSLNVKQLIIPLIIMTTCIIIIIITKQNYYYLLL